MEILRKIREFWRRRKYRRILAIEKRAFGVDSVELMDAAIAANGFLKKDMAYLDLLQDFVRATRIRSFDDLVRANRELRLGIGLFFYGATSAVAQRDGLNKLQTQYLTEQMLLMLGHSKPVASEVAKDFVLGDIDRDQTAIEVVHHGLRAMGQWLSGADRDAESSLRAVLFEDRSGEQRT